MRSERISLSKNMKTVIINGSPRKQGDTVFLINQLVKDLKGEVVLVNTYYDDIKPCYDCRYCWTNTRCCINDKMQTIFEHLYDVDNIVIASPLYFSQLTGSLLNFASRLQFLYVSRCIKKDDLFSRISPKRGVVIFVGGGDTKCTDTAVDTAKTLLRQMNANLVEVVFSLETETIPSNEDALAIEKVCKIAEMLNRGVAI